MRQNDRGCGEGGAGGHEAGVICANGWLLATYFFSVGVVPFGERAATRVSSLGRRTRPKPVSQSCPLGPRSRADDWRVLRTCSGVQSRWADQARAATAAACGAAAEVPAKGRSRHELAN